MNIGLKSLPALTLVMVSPFASMATAATTWGVVFEGNDAQGPLSGGLSFNFSTYPALQEKVLADGTRQLSNDADTFEWGHPSYSIVQGAYTEAAPIASLAFVASLLPNGSSQLELAWSLWPETYSDSYGSSSTTYRSGGIRIISNSNELFEGAFGPWTSITAATGFTTVDVPTSWSCGRFDCWEVPAYHQERPFTITSISAVPEPSAFPLLLAGALGIGMTRMAGRANSIRHLRA